jgi:putative methyltransferase (TIGR04325 family)
MKFFRIIKVCTFYFINKIKNIKSGFKNTLEIWSGDYSSWNEASKLCSGYDSDEIIDKVKIASLKVKNGEATYERDSVVFDKIEYSYPVLSMLLWSSNDNNLNVIDFGGSLGSTYFQYKFFLRKFKSLSWNIVEQEKYVEVGKQFFEDDLLKFHYSLESVFNHNSTKIDLVIMSSVLQYIEDPYNLLDKILCLNINNILIDITTINTENTDRITIQNVDPSIYTASYPCWFFDESKLINYICSYNYSLVIDWNASYAINLGQHKGYFFTKNLL